MRKYWQKRRLAAENEEERIYWEERKRYEEDYGVKEVISNLFLEEDLLSPAAAPHLFSTIDKLSGVLS